MPYPHQITAPPREKLQPAAQRVLQDPESYATTLLVLLVDRFGTEALSWAPETIRTEMASEYGVALPPASFDRLMAAVTVITTDYFYKSLTRFIDLCNVLSFGGTFDPSVFDPADPYECAWGISEALLLSPPEEDEPFADEIRRYIGAALKEWGFVKPPDVLRIAIGGDSSDAVSADYADDPGMFSALFQTQAAKSAEVSEMVRDNLGELLVQVTDLPLQNGDAKGLTARVGQEIRDAMAAARAAASAAS